MKDYTGQLRTRITPAEYKAFKALAREHGMTITGYIDAIIRQELSKKQCVSCNDFRRNSVSE